MTLSRKCEYALLALACLSRSYDAPDRLSATKIAAKGDIPLKFLEQILHMLKEGEYVTSTRGAGGGYRLAKAPNQINLAEIIRLIDGAIAPVASVSRFFYQKTPIAKNRLLLDCFQDIRDYTAKKLETLTLDQIV